MVIARKHLVRFCDHEIMEVVLFVYFIETHIGNFLNSFKVKVTFNHCWLSDEELKDNQKSDDAVTIEFKSLVIILTTSTRRSQSFFDNGNFLQ